MKQALGKGLEALIPIKQSDEILNIEINKIIPNEHQPRKILKEDTLKELANSIKEKGLLQPIIVSKALDGKFKIIAGERRWRASQIAGIKKIPALIKNVSSQEAIEIALIENIQREELNPIETAEAFQRLLKEFGITQETLSEKIGKDRATIANYIRILKLPEEIKTFINEGSISIGHAKILVGVEDKQKQRQFAQRIVKEGLTVRTTEILCKKIIKPTNKIKQKLLEVLEIEDKLIKSLGTKVKLIHKGKQGKIEIEYYSLEELDRLIEILTD